jgi:hypothetical protein
MFSSRTLCCPLLVEQFLGLPDGLLYFALDHGGAWGGKSVGYFTRPDELAAALLRFDDADDVGNWALNEPVVFVIKDNSLTDFNIFYRLNNIALEESLCSNGKYIPVCCPVPELSFEAAKARKRKWFDFDTKQDQERELSKRRESAFLERISQVWTKLTVNAVLPLLHHLVLGMDGDELKRTGLRPSDIEGPVGFESDHPDIEWWTLKKFNEFISDEGDSDFELNKDQADPFFGDLKK